MLICDATSLFYLVFKAFQEFAFNMLIRMSSLIEKFYVMKPCLVSPISTYVPVLLGFLLMAPEEGSST